MDSNNSRKVSKSVAFKLSQESVNQAPKKVVVDRRSQSVAPSAGKLKGNASNQGNLRGSQKASQMQMRRKESSERKTGKNKPSPEKEYQLSNVLRSALRCLSQLREVKEHMGKLIAKDEHISLGMKRVEGTECPDLGQLAQLSRKITILSREAFLPAHRLNQTAICLHNTEDILRSPASSHMYEFGENGRMKVPAITFNTITVSKINTCVDHATEFYNKFNCKGPVAEQMQEILLLVMRAFQDLHLTAIGCYEIFKLLLYFSSDDKQSLQDFIQSLPSVERVEMLVEVQDLRRTIDEIVIFLEKLSWGSYTVFCLASGRNMDEEPGEGTLPNPFEYSEKELMPSGSNYQQAAPQSLPAYKSAATKSWIQQNSTGEKGVKAEPSYAAMANDRINYQKNSTKNLTHTDKSDSSNITLKKNSSRT